MSRIDPEAVIVLASGSPRRRELLNQIGIRHEVRPVDLDESGLPGETPRDYVVRLAAAKARAGWAASPCNRPVLGSDTALAFEGEALVKPADRAAALEMLARLSGKTHEVVSAIALVQGERVEQALSVNEVTFREITAAEAAAYWETGEPADKAGGYAIQGRAAVFVRALTGSYSGVMGLPLFETAELLQRFGIHAFPIKES